MYYEYISRRCTQSSNIHFDLSTHNFTLVQTMGKVPKSFVNFSNILNDPQRSHHQVLNPLFLPEKIAPNNNLSGCVVHIQNEIKYLHWFIIVCWQLMDFCHRYKWGYFISQLDITWPARCSTRDTRYTVGIVYVAPNMICVAYYIIQFEKAFRVGWGGGDIRVPCPTTLMTIHTYITYDMCDPVEHTRTISHLSAGRTFYLMYNLLETLSPVIYRYCLYIFVPRHRHRS